MVVGIVLLVIGIIIGLFTASKKITRLVGKLTDLTIFVLLFFLGLSVGTNEKIISNFENIGLQSFFITIAATAGSIGISVLVYQLFFKKKEK
ncbi:MAG: LysO family transporter [Bacteroidales bacterium]